jgi:hypothetical protein
MNQIYQLSQAERPKSAAEIRQANEDMGRLVRSMSTRWHAAGAHVRSIPGIAARATAAALRQRGANRAGRRPLGTNVTSLTDDAGVG